jgi:hypothetical protein
LCSLAAFFDSFSLEKIDILLVDQVALVEADGYRGVIKAEGNTIYAQDAKGNPADGKGRRSLLPGVC